MPKAKKADKASVVKVTEEKKPVKKVVKKVVKKTKIQILNLLLLTLQSS